MLKKIVIIIVAVIIGTAVLVTLYFWNQISWPASSDTRAVAFDISKGEGVKDIAAALHAQGLVKNTFWFETYVFLDGSRSKFVGGRYTLRHDMNIREVVRALTTTASASEQVITIKEGWDIQDIAGYLADQGVAGKDDFLAAAKAADSRTIIPGKTYSFLSDKPASADLEGFLFPDTYRVYKDSTPAQIIGRMLDNFGTKFTEQMRQDAANGHLTTFEVVTLASILEKEISVKRVDGQPVNNDLNVAAGVFYNRLNQGMALQSDATLVYITGKKSTELTSEDKNIDNLYNTYTYTGLPPGPICSPSIDAIKAAIYPIKNDNLYFLTKPDGTTVFSKAYAEHLQNIENYLK